MGQRMTDEVVPWVAAAVAAAAAWGRGRVRAFFRPFLPAGQGRPRALLPFLSRRASRFALCSSRRARAFPSASPSPSLSSLSRPWLAFFLSLFLANKEAGLSRHLRPPPATASAAAEAASPPHCLRLHRTLRRALACLLSGFRPSFFFFPQSSLFPAPAVGAFDRRANGRARTRTSERTNERDSRLTGRLFPVLFVFYGLLF